RPSNRPTPSIETSLILAGPKSSATGETNGHVAPAFGGKRSAWCRSAGRAIWGGVVAIFLPSVGGIAVTARVLPRGPSERPQAGLPARRALPVVGGPTHRGRHGQATPATGVIWPHFLDRVASAA